MSTTEAQLAMMSKISAWLDGRPKEDDGPEVNRARGVYVALAWVTGAIPPDPHLWNLVKQLDEISKAP